MQVADNVDVAYLCSRDAAYDECLLLDGGHAWDDGTVQGNGRDGVVGEWLTWVVMRVDMLLPKAGRLSFGARPGTAKHGLLMQVVHKKRFEEMVNGAGL